MRTPRHWLTTAFLFLTVASAQSQAPRAATADSARLQGQWTLVEGTVDGHSIPPAIKQSMRRTLTGSHLLVAMGTQTLLDATVTLHPETRPASIDYHLSSVPAPAARQLGIYRWAGDTIEFCFAKAGQPRPADFTTSGIDGRTWTRWVRAP